MVDLPAFKDRVKVWPTPGLNVQASEVAILDGGRFLPAEGQEVTWSPFWHRRLLAGEVLLHDPRPGAAADSAALADKLTTTVGAAPKKTEK